MTTGASAVQAVSFTGQSATGLSGELDFQVDPSGTLFLVDAGGDVFMVSPAASLFAGVAATLALAFSGGTSSKAG